MKYKFIIMIFKFICESSIFKCWKFNIPNLTSIFKTWKFKFRYANFNFIKMKKASDVGNRIAK